MNEKGKEEEEPKGFFERSLLCRRCSEEYVSSAIKLQQRMEEMM